MINILVIRLVRASVFFFYTSGDTWLTLPLDHRECADLGDSSYLVVNDDCLVQGGAPVR